MSWIKNMLDKIEAEKAQGGLKTVPNIHDVGACSVVDVMGKVVHTGDAISCAVYIKRQAKIKSN